jgi:hypothetical protein
MLCSKSGADNIQFEVIDDKAEVRLLKLIRVRSIGLRVLFMKHGTKVLLRYCSRYRSIIPT